MVFAYLSLFILSKIKSILVLSIIYFDGWRNEGNPQIQPNS